MKKLLRTVFAWLEGAAAVGFLALVAIGASLYYIGDLNREKLAAVYGVIRGEKVAVLLKDHKEWLKLDEEAKGKTLAMAEEQEGSGLAREALDLHRQEFEKEFDHQKLFIDELNAHLDARQGIFKTERDKLAADWKQFKAAQAAAAAARNDQNFKKTLKIYEGRESDQIAADFTVRWNNPKTFQTEQEEIISLLRGMPERRASEIVAAITDATVRIEIMKAIKS